MQDKRFATFKSVCAGAACVLFVVAILLTVPLGCSKSRDIMDNYFVDMLFDGVRAKCRSVYSGGGSSGGSSGGSGGGLSGGSQGEKQPAFIFYPAILCKISKIDYIMINEKKVDYNLDERGCVWLEGGFESGDKVTFEYSFIPDSSGGRLGVTDKTVNFALFYPIRIAQNEGKPIIYEYTEFGDPFYFDFCNFEMRLVLPSVYSVACGMYPTECSVNGKFTAYRYAVKKVRNIAFSISDKFNVVSQKSGYKSINYYFYDDKQPEKTIEEVKNAMEYFSKIIGEYPYDLLCFAQSPYDSGGMEYSAYFVIGENKNIEEYLRAGIHETAHQWFPVAVGSDEYKRPCFDEGIAEYLTRKYYASVDILKAERLSDRAKKGYDGYILNCKAVGKTPLERYNNSLCDYRSVYEYTANAYYASSCAFEKCEEKMGKSMEGAIAKFYRKYKYKNATADDFFRCFSFVKRTTAKNMLKNCV